MAHSSTRAKASPVVAAVATGIGAALFFVLGRFAAIPIPFIPNTTINIQYAILAVFALLYGPIVACLAGGIGHFLIDVSTYGPWWSWIVASALTGLVMGIFMMRDRVEDSEVGARMIIRFNLAIIIANLVAWLLAAPILDIVFYSEPANKVFVQGIGAAVSNSVTAAIIGTIIVFAYAKTRTSSGSLSVEE